MRVLTEERHHLRGGWDVIHDNHHEDSHSQQHCDGETDFLTALWRQTERHQTDGREQHTWEEQMKEVEHRSPLHHDGKRDVREGIWTAVVDDLETSRSLANCFFICTVIALLLQVE